MAKTTNNTLERSLFAAVSLNHETAVRKPESNTGL